MRTISLKEFIDQAEADPALRAQIQACRDPKTALETVRRLAKERGYILTEPSAGKREALSDDELDAVAGGRNPFLQQDGRELNRFSWFVTIMRILENRDDDAETGSASPAGGKLPGMK